MDIKKKVCYNVSHVGAVNSVGIYVLVAHEYQEMLRANSANLPAFFYVLPVRTVIYLTDT